MFNASDGALSAVSALARIALNSISIAHMPAPAWPKVSALLESQDDSIFSQRLHSLAQVDNFSLISFIINSTKSGKSEERAYAAAGGTDNNAALVRCRSSEQRNTLA
jgi:hypothetical protein